MTATLTYTSDRTDPGTKVSAGACGEFDIGFISGFSGQGCLVVLYQETGLVGTVGAGFSTGSASASVGYLFTNAKTLEELRGYSVCYAVSGGTPVAIGGQVCFGRSDSGEGTGIASFFLSVGASLQPGASVQVAFNTSFATKLLTTPAAVRKVYDFLYPVSPATILNPRAPEAEFAPGPFEPVTQTDYASAV